MDSYTDPDNLTVNRMWKDRRAMQSVAIGVGAGELWVSMLPFLALDGAPLFVVARIHFLGAQPSISR